MSSLEAAGPASPSAVPPRDRFADIQAPLLPSPRSLPPRLWGLGLFGLLLALLLPLLLLDPPPLAPPWASAGQLRVAAALLLLGATGCLERHLITLQKHIRRQGHLGLYRRLKPLSRLPLLIATAGLAALLAAVAGSCGRSHVAEWRGTAIRVILGAEVLALAAVLAHYTVLLRQQPPRAGPGHDLASWMLSPLHPAPAPPLNPDVPGAPSPAPPCVLDRQAELLRFQQERLHHLAAEVLRLQDALAAGGTWSGQAGTGNSQADLEYWLAAREQELRTVAAERDVLAREVHGVRALLAEAHAELARLRSATKQHAEENTRLRAMRDEWSARSAKLEQTLLKLQPGTGMT